MQPAAGPGSSPWSWPAPAHHFNVPEAAESQRLEQLAADAACSHCQHPRLLHLRAAGEASPGLSPAVGAAAAAAAAAATTSSSRVLAGTSPLIFWIYGIVHAAQQK